MDFKKNKVLIAILVIITFLLFWFLIPSGAVTLKVGESYSGNSLGLKQIISGEEITVSYLECFGACSVHDKSMRIGDRISVNCAENAVLSKITEEETTFLIYRENPLGCVQIGPRPICLSENTLIDTPEGSVNIKEMKVGMPVYTSDENGNKVVATVLKTGKAMANNHKVIHLVLRDGRELYASPGHPLINGVLADLKEGNYYDGSVVVSADLINYEYEFTYDILPSGETGIYYANGVPLRSTFVK